MTRRGRGEVVVELETHGFYAEPLEDGTVSIVVPGLEQLMNDDSSPLPVKRAWVDAIAGRNVRLVSVRALELETINGLRPASGATPHIEVSRRGSLRASRKRRGGELAEAAQHSRPSAKLVTVGFQGETKKVLVELEPLVWQGRSGRLLLAKRLVVRLAFRGRDSTETSTDGVRGRRYRRKSSHRGRRVVAQLSTVEPGLYGVPYEQIFGRWGQGVRPSKLRLSRHGEAVAYHLEPDPRRFGPGSTLYFVGEGEEANPYGSEAVYELELGRAGVRMPVFGSAPAGAVTSYYWHDVKHEENRYYQAGLLAAPDI